ncbi:thiamine phosphate synthase [Candidatus Omnitrophota bacterium]
MKKNNLVYVIIDAGALLKAKRNLRRTTRQVLQGSPDLLQLRLKGLSTKAALRYSCTIAKMIAKKKHTKLIINDRVDIAKASGAQGVHLGAEDLPVRFARSILGTKAIIGKTVHSSLEAKQALAEPVDYISIGPVFKTALKPSLKPLGVKGVKKVIAKSGAKKRKIAVFVIGGITFTNLPLLTRAGLNNIAVARNATLTRSPCQTVRGFRKALSN